MNSIKITSLELESPGTEKLMHIENNSEKSQNDNNEDFTSSEKNDKIFQNLMSLSKIKNSNFEINSSTKNNDNNNSKLSIEELDTNKVKETINKENNITNNKEDEDYTSISTICNYYLQSESDLKFGKTKFNNNKKDNNDCRRNISPFFNSPIIGNIIENIGQSEKKLLSKNKSKISKIIQKIKKESRNNSFLNDKKKNKKYLTPRTISTENNNNALTKFNMKYNSANKISTIEEKKPLLDIIKKIKQKKQKKNLNTKLIPHSKINIKFNYNINNNYKPILTKRNLSNDSKNKKTDNFYHTIYNTNKTLGIYSYLHKNKSNSKVNYKLVSNNSIPKQYSHSFMNNYHNKSNIESKKNSLKYNFKLTPNSSRNNLSLNNYYNSQSKRIFSKYSIIKSPNKQLNIQTERTTNKTKNYYYTKTKINSNSAFNLCSTNSNSNSNYSSNVNTTIGNNKYVAEYTYENIPSSFKLNSENNKIKKIICYVNKMYKDFKEKEKVKQIKREKEDIINKKIEDTIIKIKSNNIG